MVTIGPIPEKTRAFFKPLHQRFAGPAWRHFCGLVMAITVGHCSTIERLAKLLRDSTHRTNHGEFLWRSDWSESAVMRQIALDMLRSLYRKDAGPCYLILDETQTLKRAKKMAGVGRLFHHATGRYGTGHTVLKACLHYRGVTIPWGSSLWLKPHDARKQDVPFLKLRQLAACAIDNANSPAKLKVTVLFDAWRKGTAEVRPMPPTTRGNSLPVILMSVSPQGGPGRAGGQRANVVSSRLVSNRGSTGTSPVAGCPPAHG